MEDIDEENISNLKKTKTENYNGAKKESSKASKFDSFGLSDTLTSEKILTAKLQKEKSLKEKKIVLNLSNNLYCNLLSTKPTKGKAKELKYGAEADYLKIWIKEVDNRKVKNRLNLSDRSIDTHKLSTVKTRSMSKFKKNINTVKTDKSGNMLRRFF